MRCLLQHGGSKYEDSCMMGFTPVGSLQFLRREGA